MTARIQAAITAVLVVLYMLAGLYFGVFPDPIDAGQFGDVLRAFAKEPQARTIFALILIDVIAGIVAALRGGTFDGEQIARFMASNVLPYVFGFMLFWFLVYFGLADITGIPVAGTLANFGFGVVAAAITMSIVKNIARPAPAHG